MLSWVNKFGNSDSVLNRPTDHVGTVLADFQRKVVNAVLGRRDGAPCHRRLFFHRCHRKFGLRLLQSKQMQSKIQHNEVDDVSYCKDDFGQQGGDCKCGRADAGGDQ